MSLLRQNLGRIRLGVKYIAGMQKMNREFTVLPNDSFLVGYPKSGTTWLRFLVANLAYSGEQVSFENIEKFIPDPALHHDSNLLKMTQPRILKTHRVFDPRFRKIVMIVRDPRDVMISYHKFCIKMRKFSSDASRLEFIDAFLSGQIDNYGTWEQNIGSWWGALSQDPERLLCVRYEDLTESPIEKMTEIAGFLNLDRTDDQIRLAVERSSANEMRKLEKQTAHKWKALKDGDQNIAFVGKAQPNAWESKLETEEVALIESKWKPTLERFGYSLTTC